MTTRVIDTLSADWRNDQSAYGHGDRAVYANRVQQSFDESLERLAVSDQTTIYREGNNIVADADYEGWNSDIRETLLDAAHDTAIELAEADAE